MRKSLTITTLALATAFSTNAEVRINGFANLVGGITSSDDTLYGYDEDVGFRADSLFAIQISGDINEKMSATGQIVARGEDEYDPDFTWAYMSYQVNDNWTVNAGRFRVPLFRYSSSLDVGYSYHWVTPPQSVYDVTFNNMDGFRLDYGNYAGDWEYNVQIAAGVLDQTLISQTTGQPTQSTLDNFVTFSIEAQREWLGLRAVYGQAKSSFGLTAFEPWYAALNNIGLSELADNIRVEDDTGRFLGVGVEVDKFDWFIAAEYTTTETENSFFPENTSYYLTAGMRFGKFTPHFTVEKFENDAQNVAEAAAIPTGNLVPFGPGGALIELRDFSLATLGIFNNDRDTYSIGFRYDWDSNIALKMQYTSQEDDIAPSSDADLLRFAVNYVF